jgi:hypothetical protein
MSPAHTVSTSRFSGPNARASKLSALASGSAKVVRRVRRRHRPAKPALTISRATRLRPTWTPWAASSACTLGAP